MSNKRNRAELEEDDYIVDEYEYPDSADDEELTQVDHGFYLRGENFSSLGPQKMMALRPWLLVLPTLHQLYLQMFFMRTSVPLSSMELSIIIVIWTCPQIILEFQFALHF